MTTGQSDIRVTMKNQNGVKVVVRATSKGVDLTVGASGVDMKLKK